MYRTSGKDGLDFEVSFMFTHIGFLLSFLCMDSILVLFVCLAGTNSTLVVLHVFVEFLSATH